MTAPAGAPAPAPAPAADGQRAGVDLGPLAGPLADELGLDLSGATPSSRLVEDLGWDSLTVVEVLAVAERLGVALPEDLVRSWRTLGDVHHAVEAHLGHSAAPRPPAPGRRGGRTELVAVHRGHDEVLWRLHAHGDHLVDYRLRGQVPSPEAFHALVWEGVLAQFLVAVGDGRVIGLVSAVQPDLRNRHVHVAAVVEPSWRSSGLVVDGLARFASYLFAQFDLRKLYAEVLERNLAGFASGRGRLFEVEGRLTEHEYVDGRYEDLLVLATTRARWRLAHQRLFGEPAPF